MFQQKLMRGVIAFQLVSALTFSLIAPAVPVANAAEQISAKALNSHECNTTEWHFVITQIDSEDLAPSTIQVEWSNNDTESIPLDKYTGKTAHYQTTSNLDSTVTSATAYIYDNWDEGKGSPQFNLSHGPCSSEEEGTITINKQFCYFPEIRVNLETETDLCDEAPAPNGVEVEFDYLGSNGNSQHDYTMTSFNEAGFGQTIGTKEFAGEITVCETNFADFADILPIPSESQTISGEGNNCLTGDIVPGKANSYTFYNYIERPQSQLGSITINKEFCQYNEGQQVCTTKTMTDQTEVEFTISDSTTPTLTLSDLEDGIDSGVVSDVSLESHTVCETVPTGYSVKVSPQLEADQSNCATVTLSENNPNAVINFKNFDTNQPQGDVDSCDPSTYNGSVADRITRTGEKCVGIVVSNVCGQFSAVVEPNKTPYTYGVSYSINALNWNFNTDASNVTFTEDQYGGKATVNYWAVGPEKDFFTALNLPWYQETYGTQIVDTNCETDKTPETPGQVLGEQIERPQVLAAVTQLPSTGVGSEGLSLIMALFFGAVFTRRRIG